MEAVSKRRQLVERLAAFDALKCPVCGEKLPVTGETLVCQRGHGFDVNKRGFINLAKRQSDTYYDEALFAARQRVFENGFYAPVMAAVKAELGPAQCVLDAGCGEGYYLDALGIQMGVGVDLSREAIRMAALKRPGPIWCVADLKDPPFWPGTFDAVLDILSPASYEAFFSVLKPGGRLLKVFPGAGYLLQIRRAMGLPLYDPGKVLEHLKASAQVIRILPIEKTWKVTAQNWRDFVYMTPLTQNLSPDEKEKLASRPDDSVTLDLWLAVAER